MRRRHAVAIFVGTTAALAVLAAATRAVEGFENEEDGEDAASPGGPTGDDLGPLEFVKTRQPLECPKAPGGGGKCVFGLYELRRKDVTFTLSTHLAGGVYKLTYKGVEFVNPVAIVGASMQTALIYDDNWSFNPTEAGCGDCDSFSGASSSKLLAARAAPGRAVYTSVRAANFFPPGKKLKWGTAINTSIASETIISKRIEFLDDSSAEYAIGVTMPRGKHWFSLLEVLCVWTPRKACETMQVLSDGRWILAPDDDPIRRKPVLYWVEAPRFPKTAGLVMCGRDTGVALGVKLVEYPRGGGWESPRYGTPLSMQAWRKWSITHRINPSKNKSFRVPGGTYVWKFRLFFGTLDRVKAAVAAA